MTTLPNGMDDQLDEWLERVNMSSHQTKSSQPVNGARENARSHDMVDHPADLPLPSPEGSSTKEQDDRSRD